jgi:hypothetical protein
MFIKSRMTRWVGRVEKIISYRVLLGKPEVKRKIERPTRR